MISEIYGKKKANQVVTVGIFAAIFSTLIIYVADSVPAMENSPVDDLLFRKVFGSTIIAVLSSMLSYLFAQYIDIHIYHFWKNLTKGRMLWLRNNFSTFFSQFVDTFTIVSLLIISISPVWKNEMGSSCLGKLYGSDSSILSMMLFEILWHLNTGSVRSLRQAKFQAKLIIKN